LRRYLAVVCLLLLPVLTAHAQEEEAVGAKACVEETKYEFGWIPAGATVTHSYVVHSCGTDSLKILKVRPG
jgi:hypothetical protein